MASPPRPTAPGFYITNEAEKTLDVVDAKTLKVITSIPLTAHPNNVCHQQGRQRASTWRLRRLPARLT